MTGRRKYAENHCGSSPMRDMPTHGQNVHREAVGVCLCGGVMIFTTDTIGRSIQECAECGTAERLDARRPA